MTTDIVDIAQNGTLKDVDNLLEELTKHHKKVSKLTTPKAFIKKKMGLDYVEYGYMRELADKYYPGWSWTVIDSENLGSQAYVVHGRLKWFDKGVWREGDVTAAHRIQVKRGTTEEFVDIGNDIKAANTDAIKKAFNMYLNIADDVYRNQIEDPELNDEQLDNIKTLLKKVEDKDLKDKVNSQIKEGEINSYNVKGVLAKLERITQ